VTKTKRKKKKKKVYLTSILFFVFLFQIQRKKKGQHPTQQQQHTHHLLLSCEPHTTAALQNPKQKQKNKNKKASTQCRTLAKLLTLFIKPHRNQRPYMFLAPILVHQHTWPLLHLPNKSSTPKLLLPLPFTHIPEPRPCTLVAHLLHMPLNHLSIMHHHHRLSTFKDLVATTLATNLSSRSVVITITAGNLGIVSW